MNESWWFQLGASFLLPFMAVVAGFFAGQRGRSIAIATTVEKDWLHTVAEDLAEFIELQIDIVWKRWRVKLLDATDPETSSHSYENDTFRFLQEALWQKTFRSDFLKSKLLLMLDDGDARQRDLIVAIDEYATHAYRHSLEENFGDKEKWRKKTDDVAHLLRVTSKPLILNVGRRVLAAKREAIRRSI